MNWNRGFLCLAAVLTATLGAAATVAIPPLELRGYGKVSLAGKSEGTGVSLATFTCESPEKAKLTGSKYLADLTAYGAVSKNSDGTLTVRHGGVWKLGLDGNRVHVLVAPDAARLADAAAKHGAAKWSPVPEKAYPAYLDNFDNAGLAVWWAPNTKTPEQMAWFKRNPVAANLHYNDLTGAVAPGVFENAGPRNAAAQLRTAGKPYRTMLWCDNGWNPWYGWLALPFTEFEDFVPGFNSGSMLGASGYYSHQITSSRMHNLQLDTLATLMERWKDDPNLLAWMEPHGEFALASLKRPPDAEARFREFLKKQYGDVAKLNVAWGTAYRDFDAAEFPDVAYFNGRRGAFVDLDDTPWRWAQSDLADGEKAGFANPGFDDSGWYVASRLDKRLLGFVGQYSHTPGTEGKKAQALWARFAHDVPASFLAKGGKVYLHIAPYSTRNCREVAVWVNGREAGRKLVDPDVWSENRHCEVEISKLLKPGRNEFAIHNAGGRIAYRVWLSHIPAGKYPYAETGLTRRYQDWNSYLRAEKFATLERWLKAIRAIDPVRPIKVMTPHPWQSEAFDLFEKYGAYPQNTGETTWYRPMNYKGYTLLRDRFSSSEPGGPVIDTLNGQHMYAHVFWESQDCHDYGFDFSHDLWKFPKVVKWWENNAPLLSTLGKTELDRTDLGELRDNRQDYQYANDAIWNWDLARGALPGLGLTPVLVDGRDLEKGLADGKVKVLLDCATSVMPPETVDAVRRYVKNGGIFIAMHLTGKHTPERRDAWPLPRAFGLTVKDKPASGEIVYDAAQTLFPSLRGKKSGGYGCAIDYTGKTYSGQVSISGPAKAVARWSDGSMAIAEVPYGKGRFILLGTPVFFGIKDTNGRWINERGRQKLLAEMLENLGIRANTRVSDPAIWFEKRFSKNGLYEVWFAAALGLDGKKKWTLDDRLNAELVALRPAAPAVEPTTAGCPDVPTSAVSGGMSLGTQIFGPYQVRQFAVVRDRAGLEGPAYWLKMQERGWYKLTGKPEFDRARAAETACDFAAKLGEAGLDISDGWKLKADDKSPGWIHGATDGSWRNGKMGSWLELGLPPSTGRVRYAKTVELPPEFRGSDCRVYLGFRPHSQAPTGSGRLFVNGKHFQPGGPLRFLRELPAAAREGGKLELRYEVTAAPGPGAYNGPAGVMYLHKFPKPAAKIDLAGEWTEIKSQLHDGGKIRIPFKGELYGLKRTVEIPAAWKGKIIRLSVPQSWRNGWQNRVDRVLVNHEHLLIGTFEGPGLRLDRGLVPGQANTLELFSPFMADGRRFHPDIAEIRLEAY